VRPLERDELGDDLQPRIARGVLQLDQICAVMPGKAGRRGRTSSFGQQTVRSEDWRQSFFGHPGFAWADLDCFLAKPQVLEMVRRATKGTLSCQGVQLRSELNSRS
jgi:hypothetical protein